MKKIVLICGILICFVINVHAINIVQFFGLYQGKKAFNSPIVITDQRQEVILLLSSMKYDFDNGTTYEIIGDLLEYSAYPRPTVKVILITPKTSNQYKYTILKGNIIQLPKDNRYGCYILNDGVNNYGIVLPEDYYPMELGKHTIIGEKIKGKSCGKNVKENYRVVRYYNQ